MGTIKDYLKWRGDLAFSEAPLNEVDCMIFSMVCYLDYQGIVPEAFEEGGITIKGAATKFMARYPDPKKMPGGILIPKEVGVLFRWLKETRRFRNVEMRGFVNEIDPARECQFSAVTFLLDNGLAVVTYRGTDDTLVGWKEDMNMCFLPVVPSQEAAAEYLQRIALSHSGNLVCTGHSKGGNLAVYAAVHSEKSVRRRVKCVFSYDGPGFNRELLDDPVYLEMRPLIRNFVPQSTVVGMLLEHDGNHSVVKSRQTGLVQHNCLTWEIMGRSFVHMKTLSSDSRRTDKTFNQWLRDMTPKQREETAEAIYQLFAVEGVHTLTDLVAVRAKWLAHSKTLDPKVHETVQRMLSTLAGLNTKNFFTDIFRKGEETN